MSTYQNELKTSILKSISGADVTNYARILCAINLQKISNVLNDANIWAFSLASDSSTHYGKSYFDNRIRIQRNRQLYNLHVLAIPMFQNHTGEYMYQLITKVLDILCPKWRLKLIGIGSDGASVMTGGYQGTVTRLEREIPYPVYRTWCGLHQLDLVMKKRYKQVQNGTSKG
jgi:hypothetical protein